MSENLLDGPVSLKGNGGAKYAEPAYPMDCPCVTIDGPAALTFPEDCLVTFRVKRGQIVARSASRNQKASASVQLQLVKLCGIEQAEADDSDDKPAEEYDHLDKLFEQATLAKDDADEGGE
jgi:hypothetical protein